MKKISSDIFKGKEAYEFSQGFYLDKKDQVNIKATTMESMGCIGREEGIAAMAVVLLTKS